MVHVRSTHVDDPQYQDAAQHWLVSVKDVSTLEETANMLAKRYSDHADALLKGKEMVEILAPLNLDTESLLAALYAPLGLARLGELLAVVPIASAMLVGTLLSPGGKVLT